MSTPSTKGEHIQAILTLMNETQTDIIGVLEYLMLEDRFNLEDDAILSWFPDQILTQVHQWLVQEKAEQEQEEDVEL